MAKKVVATMQKGAGKTFTKVVKMEKSPKTGAYTFVESMVPNEKVNEYFSKKK